MNLFSDPRWSEAFAHLPDYLGNHVRVSVTALALGLVVSLPLAIAVRNRRVPRGALLGLASIVQTVPGLALLALFYPVLLALAALSLSWFGFAFSAFGFLPAVLGPVESGRGILAARIRSDGRFAEQLHAPGGGTRLGSTAETMAPGAGTQPASPTPLTPSGLSGEGNSTSLTSTFGTSVAPGSR